MKLIKNGDNFNTILHSETPDFDNIADELSVIFENGVLIKDYTFSELRENINKH